MASSLEECVQREHAFAIVDEVDNILIDEARTPLIISGRPEQAADTYYTFARLAKQMVGEEMKPKLKSLGESRDTSEAEPRLRVRREAQDRRPDRGRRREGREVPRRRQPLRLRARDARQPPDPVAEGRVAVQARHDYAVIDGEVKIIDEFTGRILEGRRWSDGLHQAVEAKEGVAIREENQTLATITLQNYFRLYDKLSGMTGTALTEATEFMKIYEIAGGRDPDPPADDPRRPQRPDLQDQGRQVEGGRQRDQGAPREGPAGARRHDLGRDLRDALRRAEARRDRARGPQREARARRSARARPSPRRAGSARSRSPPTWPAAASTSSSAATPSMWRRPSCASSASRPATRAGTRSSPSMIRALRGAERRRRASRCSSSAACSSAAPSATSRGGSTTSFAAAPAARATRASRASSSPPRTT